MDRLVGIVTLLTGMLSWVSPGPVSAGPPAEAPSVRTERLQRDALRALGEGTQEGRRRAIRLLENAVALEPRDPMLWHILGEAYAAARFGERSRQCFRRALDFEPDDEHGWFLTGMAWRREWLRGLDPSALNRAIAAFDTCTRMDPDDGEAWLRYSGLLYEKGDLEAARVAASQSKDRGRYPDHNALARAYLAFRIGDSAGADTLFAQVLPRLEPSVRRMFERPWELLGAAPGSADASDGAGRRSQVPFWDSRDPDPTTPENEFRLEYWARVAHAYLLFEDPLDPHFDARAMTYVQYGPPAAVTVQDRSVHPINMFWLDPHTASLAEYPFVSQTWFYPQYGMVIQLEDKALVGRFERHAARADDPSSSPSEAALRAQPDVIAIDGGAALFTARPPRRMRLGVRALDAQFDGDRGTRLVTQVRVSVSAADSAVARWLVVDDSGRELARETQAPAVSACEPESLRIARFSAELPAGDYHVFVSASDRRFRRALREERISIRAQTPGVGLSDIVDVCSEPPTQVQSNAVLLEAAEEPVVRGEQALTCYFEIVRLLTSASGWGRFQYRYTLRRVTAEGKADEAIVREYRSEEIDVDGSLRRQFVTIPMSALPYARYRLTISVLDLNSGQGIGRSLDFVKD